MLFAVLDPACIDDRDYYGNKRLELAGRSGHVRAGGAAQQGFLGLAGTRSQVGER
jgi:hypothetical protein